MKHLRARLLPLLLALALLAGCGGPAPAETAVPAESGSPAEEAPPEDSVKTVPKLTIAFSPYADSDTVSAATAPLEDLLRQTLLEKGYDVESIQMSVGTSYTAVGEALSAGSADLGFISGGNYVLFSDDCGVLLTALRYAIDKDSENPADWNNGEVEKNTQEMSTYYRSILLAGPSEKGRALTEKVQSGQDLTWEDLDGASWAVMGPTSASGYIYPSLWLRERYGKTIADLSSVTQSDSYTTSLARLASGQADIAVGYGHLRTKYAPQWETDFGGTAPMIEQTGVIGVTEGIYNDMIAYSKTSQTMADEDFRTAVGEAFIEIGNTGEGREIIGVFSQVGYEWGSDANYDGERAAQELLRGEE